MKTAIVKLPDLLAKYTSGQSNVHGFWNPPDYVKSFWATGALIELETDTEEEWYQKQNEVIDSYSVSCLKIINAKQEIIHILKNNVPNIYGNAKKILWDGVL